MTPSYCPVDKYELHNIKKNGVSDAVVVKPAASCGGSVTCPRIDFDSTDDPLVATFYVKFYVRASTIDSPTITLSIICVADSAIFTSQVTVFN